MPNRKQRDLDFLQSYGFLNAFLGHICTEILQIEETSQRETCKLGREKE